MVGLKEAVALTAGLAGGVAFLVWITAERRKPKRDPGEDGPGTKEEEEEQEEERKEEAEEEVKAVEETVEVAAAAAPVSAAAANTSESKPVESAGTQVLVLGLDGAGKSSLLQCLASGSLEQDMEPTQGFNAVSINREDLHIEFLEIGGKEDLRPYWRRYMSKALLLVFVVDSSKPERFPLAKEHVHQLLEGHPSLPVMVLAHKQDLSGASSITDLHESLSLSEVGDRRLFLIGTHVKKGDAELSSGVQDARDLIFQMVCDSR